MIRSARTGSRAWVAIVLPGLLLRSLIPVGFMPMFGPGLSVSLMLCPAYAPLPPVHGNALYRSAEDAAAKKSMAMPVGMDMSTGMRQEQAEAASRAQSPRPGEPSGSDGSPTPIAASGGEPDHQDHSSCPYAASATLAGLPTLFGVSVAEQSVTRLALPLPQIAHLKIIRRAQSARAPPTPA